MGFKTNKSNRHSIPLNSYHYSRLELPAHYMGVDIDKFIVMPNYIHGIAVLNVGAGPRACPERNESEGQPRGVAPTKTLSLPEAVQRFKSFTTKRHIDCIKRNDVKRFDKHFWQRNYYEHVIRNEDDLNGIREYITNNPLKWELDEENPKKENPQKRKPEKLQISLSRIFNQCMKSISS
ncbi:MAG: transposase [Planctomycetota bacterium]|jgi:REP element-mobilizing transposase RayT